MRSPLEVGVAELRRHLGSRERFHRLVDLGQPSISTARVPEGGEIDVDVELESISNGVAVTGRVLAPWVGECRRCLEPVEGVAEAEVREIFERVPTEGETYPLVDDLIDLEPLVRDAVLLSLPLAPLCGSDCRGPAPDAFPAGPPEEGPAPEAGEARDPRWAALDELRFDEPD